MSLVGSAVRTAKRSEIAAEFYSYPQKYILGMDENAEQMDKWRAAMSSMLRIDKDEDGQHPVVGQFQQQSMTPHLDNMKMLASLFAGETGLTLDDLGFTTGNPQSFDAIRASHEALKLCARKAQRNFGVGFLNAGYLAACIRDKYSYSRDAFAETKASYWPIFEPDAAALGATGDAIYKINEAVPGYIGSRNMKQLTGMESDSDAG
jgi:hypothetical protein